MAKQTINQGTPPAGTDGDTVRAAFTKVNENFDEIYTRTQGRLVKSIAGGAGTVALTAAEALHGVIELTGAITGAKVVTVPALPAMAWIIRNGTTGNFAVTVRTAGGAGVAIPQGDAATVFSDGTNLVEPGHGPLVGIRVFTASGTYQETPGTKSIVWHLLGGGGAGGGRAATNASSASMGAGGGAGGYCVGRATSGFSGASFTIGAGGASVSGQPGGGGGASTFLGATAGGGGGGTRDGPSGPTFVSGSVGAGGTASGGLINAPGMPGSPGFVMGTHTLGVLSGAGGSSPFGAGGRSVSAGTGIGENGAGYGSGGAGSAAAANYGAAPGGNGAPGVLIIYEYP